MRWFLLLPASVGSLLLAVVLNPLVALFADEEGWLPRWLSWFGTPDNPIDGDPPFRELHAPFKGAVTGWKRWVNRTVWLYRNPAYGFDWSVLADRSEGQLVIKGTRPLGGDLSHDGWYFARVGNAWQLYVTHHWNDTHTTKINLGNKLWSKPPRQYVCSIGLWKRI